MNYLRRLVYDSDSEDEYENISRRPRTIRQRANHIDTYDDQDYNISFRLSKQATLSLLVKLENKLEYLSDKNFSVSPINQLLVALRFYATNSTQISIGDYSGISTTTANKIIHKVTAAIASLHKEYIKFPETAHEIRATQNSFYEIARFPRVIGAMDCTHVRIASVPLTLQVGGEQAELFRNRKGYFSINVQAICNANLEILDIVARWPGSTHDNTIFNNSFIKAQFESGKYGAALLVVDGGYASTADIVPPLDVPRLPVEQLFNESQIRTRNPIERCFGVWKRRFPVLALGMRIRLDKILNVIVATAVLHNILRSREEGVPPEDSEIILPAPWTEIVNDGHIPPFRDETFVSVGHNTTRDSLISTYFQNLL